MVTRIVSIASREAARGTPCGVVGKGLAHGRRHAGTRRRAHIGLGVSILSYGGGVQTRHSREGGNPVLSEVHAERQCAFTRKDFGPRVPSLLACKLRDLIHSGGSA